MTTVLKEYTTAEQRSVVNFLLAKQLIAKDIHKEIFLFYRKEKPEDRKREE
jgi:hypothetical protein